MTERLNINSCAKSESGFEIPLVGIGTGSLHGINALDAVENALDIGYRHVDTAWWYRNEREVGAAIRDSSVPREEIFITTKMWPTQLANPEAALQGSLERLGVDYVDLFLVHRQFGFHKATWRAMERIQRSGLAKNIGVSNFSERKIRKLLGYADIRPVVNQVRCSPLYYNKELHEFCRSEGITMVGYSPLARGKLSGISGIDKEARRLGITPAQLALRWALEKGIPVIPRSDSKERARINADIFGFQLDEQAIDYLESVNKTSPSFIERIKLLF
ncbi:MAG: aldo/keto reductase [Candidatus Saccharibacteria bacterium]|nr:aldo/keto reductase [Candidatus Saccharibacteria bacterium]